MLGYFGQVEKVLWEESQIYVDEYDSEMDFGVGLVQGVV